MTHHISDICIVGGGLAGKTLALALSSQDFDVTLVERFSGQAADNRVTSLNMSTAQLYKSIGLWPSLEPHSQPMVDIRVVDGQAGPRISFEALADFGEAHGVVVHNEAILAALDAALADAPTVKMVSGVAATLGDTQMARQSIDLSNGDRIDAHLICACDGARSALRDALGIETDRKSYGQANITATLTHENDHEGAGFQRFLPGGPVAFIPMQGNESSLAWTLPQAQAEAVMALDDAAFMALLSDQIFADDDADQRGPFTAVSARSTYPLKAMVAHRLDGPRAVLVGDAAHAIHPLAGQGFNLTARDIGALVDVLLEARGVGDDIGSPRWCQAYSRQRRADIMALFAATDSLNRVFSTQAPGAQMLRRGVMALGKRLPKIGSGFAQQAQGNVLGLPSLMRAPA
jgi:2-octaprenyl-6-methoxyphenol hydroxylase